MLQSIKRMLDSLEEHNIIYCHWKSNEHLREALDGDTDLDMLFLPSQRCELDAVLNECGLKRFRSMPLMQYNAIEDFIGFDKETCKIWHLHLHYRMTLGEPHLKGYTVTPYTDYILNNRVKTEFGIFTSKPEIEYILLLIRMTLKLRIRDRGKKIGKDDRLELEWLIQHSNDEAFVDCVKHMLNDDKVEERILQLYGKSLTRKNELRKFRSVLLPYMRYYTGNSRFQSRWLRTKRELFWTIGGIGRRLKLNPTKPFRRVSPSGGSVIAFMGCDGAGKSTTMSYLIKEYSKKLDVKNIYFGSGDGSSSLIRKPLKFVAQRMSGKGLGHSVSKEINEKKAISLKSRVYSIAKVLWAITLASEKKSKLKELTKSRNQGMLVLTDRYPQIVTPGYNDGPLLTKYLKGNSFMSKIAKWEYDIYQSSTINPPDLVIKLLIPTDIAIERKPEMTREEIDNKKEVVRNLNIAPSVEIDTSVDIKQSLGEVMEQIWKII